MLTEKQQHAVQLARGNGNVLITGGAGSGKTFTIKSIVEALNYKGVNPLLCCPTGKAAARIKESTGFDAATLHRACGLFPAETTQGDKLNATTGLPCPASKAEVLIIDEASMCDSSLLADVIRTVPPRCRFILVGDPNQLPPVGAGYPFRDLINSRRMPHVHLDVVHRQKGQLLNNCYQILAGDSNGLVSDPGRGNRVDADWGFLEVSDENLQAALSLLYTGDKCQETFGVAAEELLVLTPINKGDCGRVELNRAIQKAYHESRGRKAPLYHGKKSEDTSKDDDGFEADQFVAGDRVIWTKNNAQYQLVNGDTGVVIGVEDKEVIVRWDGLGIKRVENCRALNLAWAMTVHKAQGSQYRKVLVVQAGKHCNRFLKSIINRSWLYTAATRSKEATWFIGDSGAFESHVNNDYRDARRTVLETFYGESNDSSE